ncbi:chorismate synthase [Isosphaera pallida ATCC 43644]|uniref:Chorismate synthase n=1 Tax=Isosphaera pallida (strain ATCC 43644 / DSM 9630 / IS1B) TaxID=575540 RepID=E8R2Z4_ISOPI|nr:chorismate synthase [Isosphaera pallida]ADV61498.1 chorismate synthase [Isosphaera pallida ATCC 43644]
MLRYFTAGESHGPSLTAILEGFPAGVRLDVELINYELKRRQGGYGRGKRQTLETDLIHLESGLYHGQTTGAPIALRLINNDAKLERLKEPIAPRGGHVDLAGAISRQTGIRQVLERSSARETAARVAVGAVCRCLLNAVGIDVFGYVRELGGIEAPPIAWDRAIRDASPVYTLNPEIDPSIVAAIDKARQAGDTLGGVLETIVTGCPIGLGSHAQHDRKLDARLAAAVMSIQAIKGVEIGLGFEAARRPGSQVMDPIEYQHDHDPNDRRFGFRRPTNHAGGIEGGLSNGEPILIRAAKKPISTMAKRGPSVNLADKSPHPATYERSDVCAVPAASVIVENVVAFEIASALCERYVATSLEALHASMQVIHDLSRRHLETYWRDHAPAPASNTPTLS